MLELPAQEYNDLVNAIVARLPPAATPAAAPLAAALESTLLQPSAPVAIDRLCAEAVRLGCAAVCVNPVDIARAVAALRASPVRAVAVLNFPLGSGLASAVVREAAECLKLGADELDLVAPLGALESGDDAAVLAMLAPIAADAHACGARLKVILAMPLLSPAAVRRGCELALQAGADYLKTGTGFGPRGVTVEDVTTLRGLLAGRAPIKAAGGIRTRAQAEALLAAGATRLGTSAAAAILA
jgi:deoxyribose-phosphate aldolase